MRTVMTRWFLAAATATAMSTPFAAPALAQGTPNPDTFCRTRTTIEALFGTDDDKAVKSALVTLRSTAPPEIARAAKVVANQLLKKGEDAFESKKFRTAIAAVDEYTLASCPLNRIDVTGTDYTFEGFPATIPAGPTAFAFTNAAAEEPHEIVILRLKENVTESAQELLALPERRLGQKVEFVAASEAPAGESDVAFGNLQPGRYLVSCFITVKGSALGDAHWEQGMYAEFEVAAA